MEFRILGPVEVWHDGGEVSLGPKPRALLALLLLHPNEVVPADRLIDDLWGEDSPERAGAALRVNVSRLRKALPQNVLAWRAPGYLIRVEPDELDLHRFERLVEEARDLRAHGLAADTSERLREALSLWRGPALADFAYESFAQAAIAPLEELKLAALELRIEADLALGRHDELVAELEALVAEHPLRERLRSYLMTALYRSGRQAEALEAYQDARRALVDELGIDPSTALLELERAILRQDPALDVEAPAPAPIREIEEWSNLPVPASPFLGRARELADVAELFERDHIRLLTLTGPGGTGKTRLALQAAAELAGGYEHGAWWVSLAPLRDATLVLEQAAQVLGAKRELADHIRDKRLLVLFDNFEHVIEAGPDVAGLMSACPNLKVMVTSREPLHVTGESEYPVPPLVEEEAVELFETRARAAVPDFDAIGAVLEICRRLDNLPLAIELAAARVVALSPEQILERLEQRLPLLTRGPHDAPERHQTLQATIEWSYELLSEDERRLFRRLGVFAGGCRLEAAEDVADADLETLQSLVEKSLVRHSGERYRMLETIREYALDRLEEAGEADAFRRAHAEYHVGIARAIDAEIRGPAQEALLDQLDREVANMRESLSWFLEHAPERALSLTLLLDPLWTVRGHLREGGRWYDECLAKASTAEVAVRASALRQAGDIVRMLGDEPRALMLYEESLSLETELDRKPGIADALLSLGRIQESLVIFEEIGDAIGVASAQHHLGGKALEAGDYTQAREAFEQAVSIRRRLASAWALAPSLHSLGDCELLAGRASEAGARYRESLQLSVELQAPRMIAYCLAGLASVSAMHDEPEAAGLLWAGVETIEQEHDFRLLGVERERYEGLLPEAHPRFAKAHLQGRNLSFEETVALAQRS